MEPTLVAIGVISKVGACHAAQPVNPNVSTTLRSLNVVRLAKKHNPFLVALSKSQGGFFMCFR